MKRQRDQNKEDADRLYETTNLTVGERTAIGHIFHAGLSLKYSERDLRALFSKAGYNIPRSTLYDYSKRITQGGTPLSDDKQSGRPSALSPEQLTLLIGWCVKKFVDQKRCTVKDGNWFLLSKLGLSVHDETVRNYFRKGGSKSKKVVFKASRASLSMEETVDMISNFIKEERLAGNLLYDRLFATLDFVYLSHRKTSLFSYAPEGMGGPKMESVIPRFTGCVVTLLWSDGKNHTPAMLFTYDRDLWAFSSRSATAPRRNKARERLKRLCKELDIDIRRVVVLKPPEGKNKTFVKEQPMLIRLFFKHYWEVLKDMVDLVVYCDNGTALYPKYGDEETGSPILEREFNITQRALPAAVHQLLSPNDNKFHGVVKAKWRALGEKLKDDVFSSLTFLKTCDEVEEEVIENWFVRNFFLEGGLVTTGAVSIMMSSRPSARVEYFRECLRCYEERFGGPQATTTKAIKRLYSELDGMAWK
jgi:transposase